jgi:CRP-like cAMP-binding protein
MSGNHVLESLSPQMQSDLAPDLTLVNLEGGTILGARGESIRWIYFPTTCLISFVSSLQDGSTIEAELVGNDGFAGISAMFGAGLYALDAVVQVSGAAQRMSFEAFERHLNDEGFRQILGTYSVRAYSLLSQSALCLAFHPLEQRLARWLLSVHDRIEGDDFVLTQEFLATMLGVQRPTVTGAIATLDAAGLISHRRGHVKILDRARLEQETCECYAACRVA